MARRYYGSQGEARPQAKNTQPKKQVAPVKKQTAQQKKPAPKPKPKPEPVDEPEEEYEEQENEKRGLPLGAWVAIFIGLLIALVVVVFLFIKTWQNNNNDLAGQNMTDEEIEQMDQDEDQTGVIDQPGNGAQLDIATPEPDPYENYQPVFTPMPNYNSEEEMRQQQQPVDDELSRPEEDTGDDGIVDDDQTETPEPTKTPKPTKKPAQDRKDDGTGENKDSPESVNVED